jgi:hypothetical protein
MGVPVIPLTAQEVFPMSPAIQKIPPTGLPFVDELSVEAVMTPVRMASFWLAVALPFAHLSLLASGIDSPAETQAFLLLLSLNLTALVIGHGHQSD